MQMRKKLARCSQGDQTITEYSHELQELFIMIGTVSGQDQVLRFWNGVKPEIQAGLWRAQLNPEILNWDNVLAQAEIIEISENITHRRDPGRSGNHSGPKAMLVGPGFSNNSQNPGREFRSSRSMTLDFSHRRNRNPRPANSNAGSTRQQSRRSTPAGPLRFQSS
jgi:hypothetical protein